MQLANSAERYGAISRALHWLTALFVVVAWILGIMNDAFPKGEPRTAALFFHISVGLTIVDLVIMRMLWRYLDPPKPLDPTAFGSWLVAWTDPAGRIAHYCLYLLLLLVPASGVVLQFARGDALPIYGILEIPSFWSANRAFAHNIKEAHEILAYILMGLAIFHSIAALIHHFVFGDRTLVRMLPPRLRSWGFQMTSDRTVEGFVPLRRRLGLPLLVLYGTGITVGAGIYALVGAVAGHAGINTPWSFELSAVVMGLTVASYAELSTRFPVSAGEAACRFNICRPHRRHSVLSCAKSPASARRQ